MRAPHLPDEIAVRVNRLSKTFYTGFFGPIPLLREVNFGRLHRVVHAVSEVSFEIPRGQIFALLGANGAGKSTTMKVFVTRRAWSTSVTAKSAHRISSGSGA